MSNDKERQDTGIGRVQSLHVLFVRKVTMMVVLFYIWILMTKIKAKEY